MHLHASVLLLLCTASMEESPASESSLSGDKGEEDGGFDSVTGKDAQSRTGTYTRTVSNVSHFFFSLPLFLHEALHPTLLSATRACWNSGGVCVLVCSPWRIEDTLGVLKSVDACPLGLLVLNLLSACLGATPSAVPVHMFCVHTKRTPGREAQGGYGSCRQDHTLVLVHLMPRVLLVTGRGKVPCLCGGGTAAVVLSKKENGFALSPRSPVAATMGTSAVFLGHGCCRSHLR